MLEDAEVDDGQAAKPS
jgi:tetratricopeptide (TPR) repeat protein